MPIDVDGVVVSNASLSDDYNIVALRAPDLARLVQPGQFVMVKPACGIDPLLRRPFSVFEILRGEDGATTGFSLLNKQVGVGTRQLWRAKPGDRIACLGPLGRPFEPVDPPTEAWMIAGGVGLAPFATLAEALQARGTSATLFYGARCGEELFCLDLFDTLGARLVLATEDGSRGVRGRITAPLEGALSERSASLPLQLYACGPTAMLKVVTQLAAAHSRAVDVSLEQVMGCGLGGCYSCVVPVRDDAHGRHYVRSCLKGPVIAGGDVVWEALMPHA